MHVNLCRHVKTNGLQCRGVQLTGSEFCYFHRKLHRSHDIFRDQAYFHPQRVHHDAALQLPAVEDRESAQLAISCVINALASGYIDRKQANSLFYGLQLASTNVRGLRIVRRPTQLVRDVEKESASPIPETNPDLAPPGRTVEIQDPAPQSTAIDPTEPTAPRQIRGSLHCALRAPVEMTRS
ncbi:MAG TPA: hypothetical protein VGN01_00985 [Acidobacteriaceae bacterium]